MAGRRKDLGWFPMYATETLADDRFQGWTCEERGAWLTLVLTCWHVGSIPASHDLLRRTLHMDAPTFRVVWEQIGNRFAPSDEDPERLVSPRLEKERAKANRIASERAKAGANGGKAKAERSRNSSSNCQANAKQAPAFALAKPAPTPTPTPRTTDPLSGVTRLPTRNEAYAAKYRKTDALLTSLAARGTPGAWPKESDTRAAVEAAIGEQAIEAVADRVGPAISTTGRPWLGHHLDTIAGRFPARRQQQDNGRPDPAAMDYSKPPEF